jgi:hypothetical protein
MASDSNITKVELTVTYLGRGGVENHVTLVLENPTIMVENGTHLVDCKGRGAMMMTFDKVYRKSGE